MVIWLWLKVISPLQGIQPECCGRKETEKERNRKKKKQKKRYRKKQKK